MSETKPDRPRDAASVLVFDRSSGEMRVLMGRRQPTQVFMPGKFVFPGGRVDPEDKDVANACAIDDREKFKLLAEMKGTTSDARAAALPMAAIREAFEEAGVIIGARQGARTVETFQFSAGPLPQHPTWQAFWQTAHLPRPETLTFFARAITPPGRPRRYDTRFFCVDRRDVSDQVAACDGELSDLGWYTLLEIESLDLAPITKVVLDEFAERLATAPLGPSDLPIPFYYQNRGTFHRDLLRLAN